MKQKKKNGYNLDDFGLLFSEASEKSKNILLRKKNAESKPLKQIFTNATKENAESRNSAESSAKSQDSTNVAKNAESSLDSANYAKSPTSKNPQSKEQDFIYAPQFQGFDEILAQNEDFNAQDFGTQNFNTQDFSTQNLIAQTQSAESNPKSQANPPSEKDLLLRHPHTQNDTNALFVAYSILFLMLLIFMPQVYLANNIYTSSKNINLLKSQKDALRDENSDLQKRLESVKFNFLTLEIEEIK